MPQPGKLPRSDHDRCPPAIRGARRQVGEGLQRGTAPRRKSKGSASLVPVPLPPDLHVHTEWSWDAPRGDMERSCERALEIGLPAIAFTEHADCVAGPRGPALRSTSRATSTAVERCRAKFNGPAHPDRRRARRAALVSRGDGRGPERRPARPRARFDPLRPARWRAASTRASSATTTDVDFPRRRPRVLPRDAGHGRERPAVRDACAPRLSEALLARGPGALSRAGLTRSRSAPSSQPPRARAACSRSTPPAGHTLCPDLRSCRWWREAGRPGGVVRQRRAPAGQGRGGLRAWRRRWWSRPGFKPAPEPDRPLAPLILRPTVAGSRRRRDRARRRQGLARQLRAAGRGGRGRAARPAGRRGCCLGFTSDRGLAPPRAAEMSPFRTGRLTARLPDPVRRLPVAARRLRVRARAEAAGRRRGLGAGRPAAAAGHAGAGHGRPVALPDPRRVRGHRGRRAACASASTAMRSHSVLPIATCLDPRRAHRAGAAGFRAGGQ